MLRGVAVVGLLIAAAVALPHNSFLNQRSTLETELTNGPPSDWKLQGPASPEALLDVTAAVALRNTEELIEQLTARSDPDNKLYGQVCCLWWLVLTMRSGWTRLRSRI